MPWCRWISLLVAGFTGLVLFALILPAIQQAREVARKTRTRDNMHQLGIAVHNYCDVHQSLPPGGVVNADGEGYHGWMTFMLPYVDQDPCYAWIDFDSAWNDRRNDHLFRYPHATFQIPGVADVNTAEGYALTHYQANPNLLYCNSHVKFEDVFEGLEQTWLAGETVGRYQPRGYPFNWRPLGDCLNCGPETYGGRSGYDTCFLFADGSVRTIANDVSTDVLSKMAAACHQPDAAAIDVPDRQFDCTTQAWNIGIRGFREGDPFDSLYATIWYNGEGVADTVVFVARNDEQPAPADLSTVTIEFPEIRELIGAPVIDDEGARMLLKLHNLECLTTEGIDVSDAGLADLKQMKRLEQLTVGSIGDETLGALRSTFPDCEFHVDEEFDRWR